MIVRRADQIKETLELEIVGGSSLADRGPTAGQTDRGHHGGHDDEMQDFALYYFGPAKGPKDDVLLDQLQLAPTILKRLGVKIPDAMKAKPFLS